MAKARFTSPSIPVACFAPPLTDDLIARYERLAEVAPGPVRDAMRECLLPVKMWWELPESTGSADDPSLRIMHGPSPEQRREVLVKVTSLTEDLKEKLWDAIPWDYEIAAMQTLFDGIDPTQKELRDAAFHLLWYVKELNLDREPLTNSKL